MSKLSSVRAHYPPHSPFSVVGPFRMVEFTPDLRSTYVHRCGDSMMARWSRESSMVIRIEVKSALIIGVINTHITDTK